MFERLDLSALIKSVLVHLGVISMFFFSWKSAEDVVLPKAMPQHVTAVIIEKKPQPPAPQKAAPPPPKKPEPPKPEPKKPEPKKPEPKKPEPKKPEPKKPEPKKPQPKKPEPKKPEPKKPEPKKPEPKQESVDFSDILKSEMKQLDKSPPKKVEPKPAPAAAATSTSDKEQDEIQEFIGLIQQTISRNWVRPPSARTGMVVTLRINLLPGGELNDVNILKSSGNAAFDRSALAAVQKAGRFPVPEDPIKFNRNFRTLNVRFAPDDLLY
jgi:colicin import membrane protein